MVDEEVLKRAYGKAKDPEKVASLIRMLVYGKPKRGKTSFLGTFPNILILDFDGGSGVLATRGDFRGKVVLVESWEDVEAWYWILKLKNDRLKTPFQAVAWDTVSMAQHLALSEVLAEKYERNRSKDRYKPELDDYNRTGIKVQYWIDKYMDLPVHVILTAHETESLEPDEEEGEAEKVRLVPRLQTSIKGFVLGKVNTIGYSYKVVKNGRAAYYMAFQRGHTDAGDRYGLLPDKMLNPSYEQIISYYGKIKKEVSKDAEGTGPVE